MEIHAVWNRIDQLEKLVISQSTEIDSLRKMLAGTQEAIEIMLQLQQNSYGNNQTNHQRDCENPPRRHQLMPPQSSFATITRNDHELFALTADSATSTATTNNNNNNNNRSNRNSKQIEVATTRRPTYPTMNSFVHPPTAIPPIANGYHRVVLSDSPSPQPPPPPPPMQQANTYQDPHLSLTSSLHNHSHCEHYSNKDIISNRVSETHLTQRLAASGISIQPNHNNRWSTGASLGLLNSMTPNGDSLLLSRTAPVSRAQLDEETRRRTHGKPRGKFSLAEWLTCFCPCFSMC